VTDSNNRLTRIGVFYDGNYLFHVSNYYHYHHERGTRISIGGLHTFIQSEVARVEETLPRYCHIVDAHYFRGRLRASEAGNRDILLKERLFDDVLIREGITTHYLPLSPNGEKGIDVWLALEAFEQSIHKRYDVTVLVACDGDFQPLVRKLNSIGTRVMVLAWDFKYIDQNGEDRETRTAQVLLDEASYPVMMSRAIDDRSRHHDPLINGLFVPKSDYNNSFASTPSRSRSYSDDQDARARLDNTEPDQPRLQGRIQNIKNGFGFITPDEGGPNLFFYHLDVEGVAFTDLYIGETVSYVMGRNNRGPCAMLVARVEADDEWKSEDSHEDEADDNLEPIDEVDHDEDDDHEDHDESEYEDEDEERHDGDWSTGEPSKTENADSW